MVTLVAAAAAALALAAVQGVVSDGVAGGPAVATETQPTPSPSPTAEDGGDPSDTPWD